MPLKKRKTNGSESEWTDYLLIGFVVLIVVGVIGLTTYSFIKYNFLDKKTSVDACLSRYDFENARKAAQDLSDGPTSSWDGHITSHNFVESDKAKALFLIIGQEAAFYIQHKQYEKALQTADELYSLFSGYTATPNPDKAYDDIVNKIFTALIRDSNFDYAKKITVSFKSNEERIAALEKIKQIESQK